MASSKGQVMGTLLTILMLLVAQSPRTAEAINSCQLACLIGCIGRSPYLYPICAAGCLISSCKLIPPASESSLMQCKTGCIVSRCSHLNQGVDDENTKLCVISCSDTCDMEFAKSHY